MTLLYPSFTFLFAIVAYYFFQKHAHSFGLVDIPNSRSSHTKPTTRGFGVVIFLSVFLVAVFWSPLFVAQNTFFFMSMFLAMMVGLVDDVRGCAPRIKITIFILISLLLMTDGYLISGAGVYLGVNIEIVYVISIFLTLFALVVFTNAFNLIDGLDGLAGTISLVIFSVFLLIGHLNNDQLLTIIPTLFIAAIVVFLLFNWHPAKIFMGDSGSLMIGFVISALGIHALNYIEPISILYIAALPIFDSLIVFFRRISKGNSPFAPDRSHLHHIVLDQFNGNVTKTVMTIAMIQISFSAVGLLLVAQVEDSFVPLVVIVALLLATYKLSSNLYFSQEKNRAV
jgi:UDP-GlcNAc:undecaprenyl-phosphate GlcNAc-1-phosphate transferase